MISTKNKITNSVTQRKKISNLSLFFRYLTRFCIFPIDVDYEKNSLKFSFLSKKMLIYAVIFFSIYIIGTVLPIYIIGFDKVMVYFVDTNVDASATDNISMFGTFLTLFVFGGYYVMFIKKLGINKLIYLPSL